MKTVSSEYDPLVSMTNFLGKGVPLYIPRKMFITFSLTIL